MNILIGICAAGNSQRMGFDKLATPPSLHSPDTLLSRAASAAHGHDFIVALPAESHPYFQGRKDLLRPHDSYICVRAAEAGIATTLKSLAWHAVAKKYDGLAVLMADMPFVTRSHIDMLIALFSSFGGQHIVRSQCESGRDGYPVIFPAARLPDFESLCADDGIDALTSAHGVKRILMPTEAACMQVKTPEDWRQM